MWARRIQVLCVFVAATLLASCAAKVESPAVDNRGVSHPMRPAVATMPTTAAVEPTLEGAIQLVFDGQYSEAARLLEKLSAGYEAAGEALRGSQAMFWLGYCKEKTGDPGGAGQWYRKVMARHPQTEAARLAQDRLDGLPVN